MSVEDLFNAEQGLRFSAAKYAAERTDSNRRELRQAAVRYAYVAGMVDDLLKGQMAPESAVPA